MLLNISIENFRSYDKLQTLSLLASNDNETNANKIDGFVVRKSAVIYGANASGKSNLIKALQLLQLLLHHDLGSPIMKAVMDQIYQTFFGNTQATKLIIDFEINSQVFTYHIVFDAQKIYTEKLLNKDEQIIFTREFVGQEYIYVIGKQEDLLNEQQLTVANEILKSWQLTTTEKQLFLRRAVENGSEKLKFIAQYIKSFVFRANPYTSNDLNIVGNDLNSATNYYNLHSDSMTKSLNAIGAKLEKLEIIDQDVILPNGNKSKARTINSHYSHEGKDAVISFYQESDGTIKFFNYFALINHIISNSSVLIIDELETHFHPLLVEEIIRAIHNSNSKAQLIFTTHNPVLLNASLFEPDQIYFAKKNNKNATELYSLVDFSDLQDDDWQAKYLTGNFGAIPFINSLYLDEDK